jgi:anti-sigma B factor antagonist
MRVQVNVNEGYAILSLEGDLIGEEVGQEIIEAVNNLLIDGIKYCAMDISDVRFVNSSGIGVLITVLTKLRNKDGELVLVNPSSHVKKLLIITKLHAIFKITDTLEEGVQSLKS